MQQEKIVKLEQIINSDYNNIAGIIVSKNNKTIYEKYYNDCLPQNSIHIYSITKSLTSIIIGIAIDKGYIKSVNQKVLEFSPIILLNAAKKIYIRLRLNTY